MNMFGGVAGLQEGLEAGLQIGGLSAAEQHIASTLTAGLGATALGVIGGRFIGDVLLSPIDSLVGDGGIGFIPALTIGGFIMWHNLRENTPQQTIGRIASKLPYAGYFFAGFEGIESGILTRSTHASLLLAEIVTVGAATATTGFFAWMKTFATKKLSPRKALRAARGVALAPVVYFGIKATPEIINDPKVLGVGIACLGTAAVGGALGSFWQTRSDKQNEY